MRATLQSILLTLIVLFLDLTNAYITHEEQEMIDWILREGGEAKVTISRRPDGVRGVFTTQDIQKGELLVRIPDHLVLSVRNVPASEGAPMLLKELHSPCSRLAPYLRILPNETQVLTGYNFPVEYVKYLADENLERQVLQSFKKHASSTLEGQNDDTMVMTIPEAVGRVNISLPYFEYVVSMLTSRTFGLRKEALSMVPLLDLMNHDPRDFNSLDSSNAAGVRLVAGKDLVKGEEVTITYGNMRSDDLLLYYGFLDTITSPPRLLSVDRRNYIPHESSEAEEAPLTGPPEAVRAEVIRLQDVLTRFEKRLIELGPMPASNPYVAGLLRQLHDQRRTALRTEIARLQWLLGQGEREDL